MIIKVLVDYDTDTNYYTLPSGGIYFDTEVPEAYEEQASPEGSAVDVAQLVSLGVTVDEILKLKAVGLA